MPGRNEGAISSPARMMKPRSGSRCLRSGVGTQMMIDSLLLRRLLSVVKSRRFTPIARAIRSEETVVIGE